MVTSFVIDGIDRLGKNTLIDGIRDELGYFEMIHFQKPQVLRAYADSAAPLITYQYESFKNGFLALQSGARFIFNRSWIGEAVYGPLYRSTNASWIWNLEQEMGARFLPVRLILLTEDFEKSTHFVDDGLSFDPSARQSEQARFIHAFGKSEIQDKRLICVTDPVTGGWRRREDILAEAIS
jgi:hypothetical protein